MNPWASKLSNTFVVVLFAAQIALAQEPAPAISSPGRQQQVQQETQQDVQADTENIPSVGGRVLLTPTLQTKRSFLIPSLSLIQYVDSAAAPDLGRADLGYVTSVSGTLQLQRLGRNSNFALLYAGQGSFRTNSENDSSHSLALSENLNRRRWATKLDLQLSYTPEANFGYYGLRSPEAAGTANLSVPIPSLDPRLVPAQSVITARSSRVSAGTGAEVDILLNRNSSLSFTGGVGTLRFMDSALLDSNQYSFSAGYNHRLSITNTIGLSYIGGFYRFGSLDRQIDTHAIHATFRHSLGGRYAIQFSAGPQQIRQNLVGLHSDQYDFSGNAGIYYTGMRSSFAATFSRDVTSGSGVFDGALTTLVQLEGRRTLSRSLGGTIRAGYAKNDPLSASGVLTTNADSVFFGVGMSHALSDRLSAFFSYDLQYEVTGGQCAGCLDNRIRHVGGVGVRWSPRPVALR